MNSNNYSYSNSEGGNVAALNITFVKLMEAAFSYNCTITHWLKIMAREQLWEAQNNYIALGGQQQLVFDVDEDRFHIAIAKL